MFRYMGMAPVLFACCAALACQSYTTGMRQGVTKVDETAAISALHSISVAQRTYSVSNGGSYGTFEQLVQAGLLVDRNQGTFDHAAPTGELSFPSRKMKDLSR